MSDTSDNCSLTKSDCDAVERAAKSLRDARQLAVIAEAMDLIFHDGRSVEAGFALNTIEQERVVFGLHGGVLTAALREMVRRMRADAVAALATIDNWPRT